MNIIFDMDGVIFDSESMWKEAFLKANEEFSVNFSEEYRQSTCGKSENDIRAELKKRYPVFEVDKYRDYILQYVKNETDSNQIRTKDGFENLVVFLKNNNYKLALATSSKKDRAMKLFQNNNLSPNDIFEVMIFSEDVGVNSKPNPFIFQEAAKRLNVNCSDCIVIEDSPNGIVAAHRAGMLPIMVVDLIKPNDFCKKNCYKIIRSLAEVKEILVKNAL